jgi:glucosylceramidase
LLLSRPLCQVATAVDWFQTAQDLPDRLQAKSPLSFTPSPSTSSDDSIGIKIDPTSSYQSMMGFGGALTQSSATVYKQLSEENKKEFIAAYYGEGGLGYSTGR